MAAGPWPPRGTGCSLDFSYWTFGAGKVFFLTKKEIIAFNGNSRECVFYNFGFFLANTNLGEATSSSTGRGRVWAKSPKDRSPEMACI